MVEKTLLVLGCGMQGKAALDDLFHSVEDVPIIVVDNAPDLDKYLDRYNSERITAMSIDISQKEEVIRLMSNAEVVVEALPPQFALPMAQWAAEAGVSLVSSMYFINPAESDPAIVQKNKDELVRMDKVAREKGIVILPEFGLDPGIDLVLGAKALSEFDKVHTFNSYGTGVPVPEDAQNPLKYKFSWSVLGVLRATKRPGKIIQKGKTVEVKGTDIFKPGNVHLIQSDDFGGDLECFTNGNAAHYVDVFGLDDVQEMGRYACRYPGHSAFWNRMVNSGFLNKDAIPVKGCEVVPIEFTAALLSGQEQFLYNPDEADIVMVRVDVAGWKDGNPKQVSYEMVDRRDMQSGFTAMQRTVGFTMGFGARLLLAGKLNQPGLISPLDISYEMLTEGLAPYQFQFKRTESDWNEGTA